MNCLFWAMTGFLLILGAAQLWEMVLFFWYRPKTTLLRREVIPVGSSDENLEQLLHYVSLTSAATEIILLDMGLSEEAADLCFRFCEAHKGFFLLKEEEAKIVIFSGDFPPKELESEENP